MPGDDLNPNELEALRILWEEGPLKPAEIEARFGWPIENATLRSVLVNLVDRGHVERELQGKAFFYNARVAKTTMLQSMMRSLARVFAGGSHQGLVAQLVETGDLKPEDLVRLRRLAGANVSTKGARKAKGTKS
ncbi:MAG: BlaI/MecI/CopY family transcriptional regulator [Verrucomicrobiales bacterium]|nr:BlaI/MecI/CopY family transcriptional regulator [Verrucomicrobiales bacterium]